MGVLAAAHDSPTAGLGGTEYAATATPRSGVHALPLSRGDGWKPILEVFFFTIFSASP